MKNTDWPAADVERVAKTSGKPLEVTCALEFKKRGWQPDLGTYFTDSLDSVPRELDVLATKRRQRETKSGSIAYGICAVVSCKDFRRTCSPVAFSLSRDQIAGFPHRFPVGIQVGDYGLHQTVANGIATSFVNEAGLHLERKLVAYDVLERDEIAKKTGPIATFKSSSDKKIYEGLDSALKAAVYWRRANGRMPNSASMLYVPILLLGMPFWNVPIDDGKIGTAEISRRGYQTCSYPVSGGAADETITSVIWASEECAALVEVLDRVLDNFGTLVCDAAGR